MKLQEKKKRDLSKGNNFCFIQQDTCICLEFVYGIVHCNGFGCIIIFWFI